MLEKARSKLGKGGNRKKLAFLSFSSGTTGLPKGVMIQHYAPIANVLQNCVFNEMQNPPQPGDRYQPGKDVSLGGLPFYHIYGLVVSLLFTFFSGITNVCIPKFKGIEAMIRTALKYRITLWWLVPPQVVLLVKDPSAKKYYGELRELVRFMMIGAAPLSDDLSGRLEAVLPGLDWGQGWGMTECCTVGTMHPPKTRAVFGSAGRLFPNVSAKVVNAEGKEVGVDEAGEFWIKAPTVTLGYLSNEKATEEMWLKDGWLRTGDEVKFNKEGDMFIVDRLKELIKVKGEYNRRGDFSGGTGIL
jgi:acyl-CoA synthetase (AMP-forming)/AMP-acid ligase II